MREAGLKFEQRSPPYSDPDQPPRNLSGDDAQAYAQDLARQKAHSLAGMIGDSAVLLAADTICVDHDGVLLGKPADRDDANQMIRRFMTHPHRVISGVAIQRITDGHADAPQTFADTATVTFGDISDDQLNDYLDTDDWQGKAGGYNLFDRQADGWPIEVAGDPTTVVGLPMRRLMPLLEAALNSGG